MHVIGNFILFVKRGRYYIHETLVLIAYAQRPPMKANVDVSSGVKSKILGPSLHLGMFKNNEEKRF